MKTFFASLLSLMIVAALSFNPPLAAGADDTAAKAPTTAPDQGALKFYGTISAVDAKARTFTVDNQVYHVIAETQMTKAADGSNATFDDVTAGEPARGTYTKAADGTLNVTKVRFGKKAGGGKANGKGAKNGAKAATQPEKQ